MRGGKFPRSENGTHDEEEWESIAWMWATWCMDSSGEMQVRCR